MPFLRKAAFGLVLAASLAAAPALAQPHDGRHAGHRGAHANGFHGRGYHPVYRGGVRRGWRHPRCAWRWRHGHRIRRCW